MLHEYTERFLRLYEGYTQAYGQFALLKANDSGKMQGRASTVRGEVDPSFVEQHLNGTGPGLGVIMLRDDDTVVFGAIDYDNKQMDHKAAEAAVRALKLPLVLCRSKSGGGHFYCFTSEPVPADLMRRRLGEWSALLRMAASTEIFPKQSSRFNKDDVGSWINLPYYNHTRTTRYALHEGVSLSLEEFLDLAESKKISLEELDDWQAYIETSELFDHGPPCLQLLHTQGGFVDGTKKDGMFNVVVYLKKRFPDDWADRVEDYNRAMAGLKAEEVVGLVKSHSKKEYSYKCKLPPINAVCQRKLCLTRSCGVGTSHEDAELSEISSLTRYEPPDAHDEPVWALEVKGRRIRLSNEEFFSQTAFRKACLARAGYLPPSLSPPRWDKFQRELLTSVTVVPMPDDAGPLGQLWRRVEMFASQQVMATEVEGILRGAPFRKDGQVFFRSMDLFNYLQVHRVRYREQDVWALLRDRAGGHEEWELGGAVVQVWRIPTPKIPRAMSSLQEDEEPATAPSETGDEPF